MTRMRRAAALLLLCGVILLAAVYTALAAGGQAAPLPVQAAEPTPPAANLSIGSDTCLSCHSNPNLNMKLENGDIFSLYIPADIYQKSIHGDTGIACAQCHIGVGSYPHPAFTAQNPRDVTLKLNDVCERCHTSETQANQKGVHAAARAEGKTQAAVCTDCHTAHAVRRLLDPQTNQLLADARQWIPDTCARCHYAIYQKYTTSVHGSQLIKQNNPDVPTCIDCHGVHDIASPVTPKFRLNSPQICARCHTNPQIMDKYGLSTQVLSTYVSDFHGTTVTIFQQEFPGQETNKPVCYDCHGVHDIKSVRDPVQGLEIKKNLLDRCRQCHPGASTNFPTAWLSHYIPSPDRNPLVFSVDLFYKVFIPGVLGGMAVLVALDISSLITKRKRRTSGAGTHAAPAEVPGRVGVFETPDPVASALAASTPAAIIDPPPAQVIDPDGLPGEPAGPVEQAPVPPQEPGTGPSSGAADAPAPPVTGSPNTAGDPDYDEETSDHG